MKILNFREAVIEELLEKKMLLTTEHKEKHTLEKTSKIRRCKRCFEMISKEKGTGIYSSKYFNLYKSYSFNVILGTKARKTAKRMKTSVGYVASIFVLGAFLQFTKRKWYKCIS